MSTKCETTFWSPIESDTEEFLTFAASQLEWGDLSGATLMDIGCGTGRSCKAIVTSYPKIKKVVGIDCVFHKIRLAKLDNEYDQIEYHAANIENRFSLVQWEGEINKIFSVFCFNWVWDLKMAFQNVYNLLQPGGAAAILLTIDSPFYNCLKRLVESTKWNEYFQDLEKFFPDGRKNKLEFSEYKTVLERIGFEIILCEKKKRVFEYSSKEIFNVNCVEKFPLLPFVPHSLKEEFQKDFFSLFEEQNGRTSAGMPRIIYYTISILIRKRNSSNS